MRFLEFLSKQGAGLPGRRQGLTQGKPRLGKGPPAAQPECWLKRLCKALGKLVIFLKKGAI